MPESRKLHETASDVGEITVIRHESPDQRIDVEVQHFVEVGQDFGQQQLAVCVVGGVPILGDQTPAMQIAQV